MGASQMVSSEAEGAAHEAVITPDEKPLMMDQLRDDDAGPVELYNRFFVGEAGLWSWLRYDLIQAVSRGRTGAAGYWLRRKLYGRLLNRAGANLKWGVAVSLRHPGKMSLGDRTAIDDNVLLCARGADPEGFSIGADVLVGRFCVVQVKRGTLDIGDHCVIGTHSQIVGTGGVEFGRDVMTGPQCYFGGSRHGIERSGTPMMDQPTVTRGPIVIGDDVWLGVGVRVMDGVRIGTGAVIGAGAVVTRDIPPFAIAQGIPARPVGLRS